MVRRKRCLQSLTYHLVKFIFHLCKRRARLCGGEENADYELSRGLFSVLKCSPLILNLSSDDRRVAGYTNKFKFTLKKSKKKIRFCTSFSLLFVLPELAILFIFSAIRSDHSAMSTFSCQTIVDPQRSSKLSCVVSRVRNIRISQIQ